jgi:hypothetical protein
LPVMKFIALLSRCEATDYGAGATSTAARALIKN